MTNQEIMMALRKLKKDGVSYKYISEKCGITLNTFYQYTHREFFPYEMREKLSNYILTNFKEDIYNE